ncbi:hypothetical protein BDZ89DRAFT_543553 [Hymenopellis radicata]|nr:hypothetical protein BDZ89DRAFT_543553 [Hymenopellis radicata]
MFSDRFSRLLQQVLGGRWSRVLARCIENVVQCERGHVDAAGYTMLLLMLFVHGAQHRRRLGLWCIPPSRCLRQRLEAQPCW